MVSQMQSGEMNLEDVIAFAANENFDAIELLMVDFNRSTSEINTMLEKHRMKISCINTFVDLTVQDEAAYSDNIVLCQKIIDKAVELSAPMVMLVPAFPHLIESEEDKQRGLLRIIPALKSITAYAQSRGIVLTIENYPALQTPFCSVDEVKTILEQVPDLKLTLDYGNFLVANDDPIQAYETLKSYIVNVHLKDWQFVTDQTGIETADGKYLKSVIHGQGVMDFSTLFSKMHSDKYKGYFSFEYEGELDAKEAIRQGMIYLREQLNNVKNQG